ncbi:MAG: homoserine dehydrogenase, partial [Nitrosopumilaceae archaeon]|nr:homoserine dehydrogenase [Nitrosopumilaceae archaeon]NIU85949.1 homoserine dehydrogenase [Nitrosopumilaceae archaeon]NIV64773.1 homoserine dehydrogenase [Nitrosopumilaceae archaeon]NIX61745.1 homoserine dehydrogenase [Nitrosopumilaceae archaeon]
AKYGLKPHIVGVFDKKGSAVNPSGLDLVKLIEIKKKHGSVKEYSNYKKDLNGSE